MALASSDVQPSCGVERSPPAFNKPWRRGDVGAGALQRPITVLHAPVLRDGALVEGGSSFFNLITLYRSDRRAGADPRDDPR